MQKINLKIPQDAQPIRIDKYLCEQLPHLSRSEAQRLIAQGRVRMESGPVRRCSEKALPGECYEIDLPSPEPLTPPPEAEPLDVLYQDEHMAVINKPPGLPVHAAAFYRRGTLANRLKHHIQPLSNLGGEDRPGIVHRLDRGTSGVLLIAKTNQAHRALSAQFKARQIQKTYWAVVHGVPPSESGAINLAIARHAKDRKRMAVATDGRPALTRYKVLKRGLGGSWLEVYPITGRTHQIRVHLKHLGCPVIGDRIYGTRKTAGRGQLERLFEGYSGIALHARRIELNHPISQEPMVFEAPVPSHLAHGLDKFL